MLFLLTTKSELLLRKGSNLVLLLSFSLNLLVSGSTVKMRFGKISLLNIPNFKEDGRGIFENLVNI